VRKVVLKVRRLSIVVAGLRYAHWSRKPQTQHESATRDPDTKSPLPPVVSRPLTEAPGFPESRAVRSPPSPFSSIHPSHAPTRRDHRLSGLPHVLSRLPIPPFIRFLSIPFQYQVPALHTHPSIASPEAPTTQPLSFPSPRPSPQVSFYIHTSPPWSPGRTLAIPIATPPSSLPGATWLRSKVEPWTFSPDPLRCQSHCAPTVCLIHV
jgi:hypothetical protein